MPCITHPSWLTDCLTSLRKVDDILATAQPGDPQWCTGPLADALRIRRSWQPLRPVPTLLVHPPPLEPAAAHPESAPSSTEPDSALPTTSAPLVSPSQIALRTASCPASLPSSPCFAPVAVVCFSYQSKQEDFLIRLRTELNRRGISSVDGTQVLTSL